MPNDDNSTWGHYSQLVLKELERLNSNYESMRNDFNEKFEDMSKMLSDFKNTERLANENKEWANRVTDVWSPTQMKEAKDEIYAQKNKWIATMAVMAFIEVLLGFLLAWANIKGH